MKKYLLLILLLVLPGCSLFEGNVTRAMNEQVVPWQGKSALMPHPEAEAILVAAFSDSTIPWDNYDLKLVKTSRSSIEAMFQYMSARMTLDSNLPYYVFKSGFEFTQYHFKRLQSELDKLVLDGELSERDSMIYYYVMRDVEFKLKTVNQVIRNAEDDINGRATDMNIDQMMSIYETIRPLISFL